MYAKPLSVPEIQHNARLLYDQYDLLNPYCLDCAVFDPCDFDWEYVEVSSTPTPTQTPSPTPTPYPSGTQLPSPTPTPTPSTTPGDCNESIFMFIPNLPCDI